MGFFRRKHKQTDAIVAPKRKSNISVGLSLSGGGARGFAHIGCIKAFNEAGIDFDFVSGTSAGSIVGAMYCLGFSVEQMYEIALSVTMRDIKSSRIPFLSSSSEVVASYLNKQFNFADFNDLAKPFTCVAVDIISGEEIVLSSGNLAKAVSASCAVPMVFTPVEYEGKRLVDGGLLNTIPADVVRSMGARCVISVDLNSTRGGGTSSKNILDMMWAAWNITMKQTALKGILNSDIVIEPSLKSFKSTSLDGREQMIEEGYRATMERLPEIKSLLGFK